MRAALLLAWIVPYFLITGQFHAKFLRYLLPISPVLCLFAAQGFVQLWDWVRASRPRLQSAVVGLVALVVGLTALNAVAYVRVYAEPHTAVTASRWIYANVPAGATIATEHWEEGLPVAVLSWTLAAAWMASSVPTSSRNGISMLVSCNRTVRPVHCST